MKSVLDSNKNGAKMKRSQFKKTWPKFKTILISTLFQLSLRSLSFQVTSNWSALRSIWSRRSFWNMEVSLKPKWTTLAVTIKQGNTRRHISTSGSRSLRLKSGRSSKKVADNISKISRTITSKRTAKIVLTKSTMKNICRLKGIRKLLISFHFWKKRLGNLRLEAKTNLVKTRLLFKMGKKKLKNESKRKNPKCTKKSPCQINKNCSWRSWYNLTRLRWKIPKASENNYGTCFSSGKTQEIKIKRTKSWTKVASRLI